MESSRLDASSTQKEPVLNSKNQTKCKYVNSKTRRTLRKNIKKSNKFTILGNNINGISSKRESLMKNIKQFQVGAFMIQESKLSQKGQFQIPEYVMFEVIRKGKEGGSLLTGIHTNLEPVLIFEDEDMEILVVQIRVKSLLIRLINAYGPQEYSNHEKIISFYSSLDQLIQNAKMDGCLLILEFDANAKVGFDVIKNDPCPQSPNGKILLDLVDRNSLVICNASNKCSGLITRRRKTNQRLEESIIDYLIVCEGMFEYLESMKIDYSNIHERYIKRNNVAKAVPSDHIPIFATFSIQWSLRDRKIKEQKTIFNFKDQNGLLKFRQLTSENQLSSVFQNGHLLEESRLWLNKIQINPI